MTLQRLYQYQKLKLVKILVWKDMKMREKFLMIRAFKFTLDGPPIHALLINTFDIGLLAWETNIDTQPAFDYHKAITYM